MKNYIVTILLLLSAQVWAQEIVRVTQAEYDSHRNQNIQYFDTTSITATERQQTIEKYYSIALDDEEKGFYNQGELQIQVGRFTPSGVKGVYINHPLDGFRRMYLNDKIYDTPLYCDNYNYFRNGLFAGGYYKEDSLQGSLCVYSVQGWDILNISYIRVNQTPFGFKWTTDGWLYFRGGYDYYKTHINSPTHRENCLMDDMEISQQEFLAAQNHSKRYNIDRYDRTPTAADTAATRQYASGDNILYTILLEEIYTGQFGDGGPSFIEITGGDYCCTRLLGDTTCMEACHIMLSRDNLLAGINYQWSAPEEPTYIYIYPYPADSRHVDAPYIYQTTPAWNTSGSIFFWGEDGWLYVEGWKPDTGQSCYHKVRPPSGIRR